MEVLPDDKIVVWFSCGAASAVAAKITLDKYGKDRVRVVNNPIKQEDEDNQRFLRDVQQWLGVEIESATHSDYPDGDVEQIWDDRQFISGPMGAPCTVVAKKGARQQWEARNPDWLDWLVLGFTADEKARSDRFRLTERGNLLPVLIDAGMTKQMCFGVLDQAGLKLPRVYAEGYPNANCIGCVKASSPSYWNLVRETRPDVFASRAEQSRRIGARLVRVKNKRLFLDELLPTDKGRPLRTLKMPDCGIFCEER